LPREGGQKKGSDFRTEVFWGGEEEKQPNTKKGEGKKETPKGEKRNVPVAGEERTEKGKLLTPCRKKGKPLTKDGREKVVFRPMRGESGENSCVPLCGKKKRTGFRSY